MPDFAAFDHLANWNNNTSNAGCRFSRSSCGILKRTSVRNGAE